MQSFLLLLAWVWLVLPGLWIFVLLLIPLVEVEVVAHLPDCLGCRGLVFYWHFGHTRIHIIFDIISIEDVLVLVIYLDVFVALDAVVVVTCYSLLLCLLNFIQLFVQPVSSLVRLKDLTIVLLFLLFSWLGWRRGWWWWLGSSLDIVGWKEAFLLCFFDDMAKPPSRLISLLN